MISFRKKLLPVFLLVLFCGICVSCGDETEEVVLNNEFRFITELPDGNESEKYDIISAQGMTPDGQFCEMVGSSQHELGRNEMDHPALIYSPNYVLRVNPDNGSITTIELANLDAEEEYILSGKKYEAELGRLRDESTGGGTGELIERSELDIEEEEPYDPIISGGIWLNDMVSLPDGGYICYGKIHINVIANIQNPGKVDYGRRLIRYSADGKVVKFVRLNELDEDLNAGLNGNQYLFAYSDGLLYMVTLDGNVFVINEDLNLVTKFALPEEQAAALAENSVDYSAFLTTDKDGKMVFACGVTVNGQKKYACYPLSGDGLGEQLELPDTGSRKPILANGYDVYYSDSTGLYGMNNGDKEPTILFRWVDVDLASSDVSYMKIESPEKIHVITTDNKVGVIVSGDNVLTGKTIIRLAYEEDSSYNARVMAEKARAFNLESDKYRVELVAYNTDDVSTANEKLLRDMVSKKLPEIIFFSSTITPEDFIKAGALADLYKFMDKDDKYTRDAFVPCVLGPMETGGELPYLTVGYGFLTLAGKESVLGNMTSWTIDDFADFVSGIGKGQYLTYTRDSDGKTALLDMLLPSMLNDFIDYDKGKCNFDERFSKLLEICNTAPVKTDFKGFPNPKDFDDGEFKLLILGDSNYLTMKTDQVRSFGQTAVTKIGYPQSEDVSEKTVIYRGRSFGISKRSKKKDAAWEFLRWYLDDQLVECKDHVENPGRAVSISFVPTYEAMDVAIESLTKAAMGCIPRMKTENGETFIASYLFKPIYYDGTENEVANFERNCESVTASGGTVVKVDENDIAGIRHLLENVKILRSTDTATMGIIKEEASAYFAGAQTLERTVEIITDRVQTRLSE